MRACNQFYLSVFNSATWDIPKLYLYFISYITSSHPDFHLDCSEEQDCSSSNGVNLSCSSDTVTRALDNTVIFTPWYSYLQKEDYSLSFQMHLKFL